MNPLDLPVVPPKARGPLIAGPAHEELQEAVECVRRLPTYQRNGVSFHEVEPMHTAALLNAGYIALDATLAVGAFEVEPDPPTGEHVFAMKRARNLLRAALAGREEITGSGLVEISLTLARDALEDLERALGERAPADVIPSYPAGSKLGG